MLERRKLQRLPLSYADFRTIREGNYKYIDKTEYIYNLVEQGGMFFLARPRRFGKSLTLRTIQALYQGSENLFEGLWIHDYWDFTKIHPVFHLSMKSVEFKECDLLTGLTHELDSIAKNEGIVCTQKTMPRRFAEILQALSKRAKVVVLIDEYDAPIMEFLGADTQKARENRDVLRTFYTVLKENDTLLEFVMLTGITKFTKVGVFSGLNNLTDISMSEEYAGMLGYTQTELEANFQEYIQAVGDRRSLSYQEMLEKMKFWYNGYRFNVECPTMYNPVSLHLLFFNK